MRWQVAVYRGRGFISAGVCWVIHNRPFIHLSVALISEYMDAGEQGRGEDGRRDGLGFEPFDNSATSDLIIGIFIYSQL